MTKFYVNRSQYKKVVSIRNPDTCVGHPAQRHPVRRYLVQRCLVHRYPIQRHYAATKGTAISASQQSIVRRTSSGVERRSIQMEAKSMIATNCLHVLNKERNVDS